MKELEKRIVQLESLLTMQDDTIEQLSQHVYQLQLELQAIGKDVEQLKESSTSGESIIDTSMRKPPHH